jgi:hypothetical protein
MGKVLGFVGLLISLGIGMYLYTRQSQPALQSGMTSPKSAIDITAVKNDLVAIANAQRRFYALNARYASLEELRGNGDTNVADSRGPYAYSVEAQDEKFVVRATYSGDDANMPRILRIDHTMQISNE